MLYTNFICLLNVTCNMFCLSVSRHRRILFYLEEADVAFKLPETHHECQKPLKNNMKMIPWISILHCTPRLNLWLFTFARNKPFYSRNKSPNDINFS